MSQFAPQTAGFYLVLMRPNTDGVDYTLANPDTLTKYKEAGQISQRVLKAVAGCQPSTSAATSR
jgi:hypothetical protein